MAVIANLDVILSAQTEKLEKGLSKAMTKTALFSKGLDLLGQAASKAWDLIQSGAALAAEQIGAAAERIDVMAKASQKLGISVKDWQALGLAADLGGAGAEKMERAMALLLRRVDEANTGLPAAQRAFSMLGLDSGALAGKSAIDQFKDVANAISGIENQSTRARIAMELFGRSGADLLPTLQGTAAAIEESQKFLKDFNLELTDMDARGVEGMNDSWALVSNLVDGVWNRITSDLAPALEALAMTVLDVAGGFDNLDESSGAFADVVESAIPSVLDGMNQMAVAALTIAANILRIAEAIEIVDAKTGVLGDVTQGIAEGVASALGDFGEAGDTPTGRLIRELEAARDKLRAAEPGDRFRANLAAIEGRNAAANFSNVGGIGGVGNPLADLFAEIRDTAGGGRTMRSLGEIKSTTGPLGSFFADALKTAFSTGKPLEFASSPGALERGGAGAFSAIQQAGRAKDAARTATATEETVRVLTEISKKFTGEEVVIIPVG